MLQFPRCLPKQASIPLTVRGLLLLFLCVCTTTGAAATLTLQSARYQNGLLKVRGSYVGKRLPADGLVRLHDRKLSTLLGQVSLTDAVANRNRRRFTLTVGHPYDIPCAVKLSATGVKDRFKKVKGAPKKNCSTGKRPPVAGVQTPAPSPAPAAFPLVPPLCQITEPAPGAVLQANAAVTFKGRVKANDTVYRTLSYEWDFAGGAMERPVGNASGEALLEASPVFVRDNSMYRVTLSARDGAGQRCEASVEVTVGAPPSAPAGVASLAAASRETAPPKAVALQKAAGAVVVLPYEDYSMQCGTDAKLVPNNWVTYLPSISNLKAQVFEKARLPKALNAEAIELRYLAASNPNDPAGADSINATSQNWPVGASLLQAEIQKTDIFEAWTRPAGFGYTPGDGYTSSSWIAALSFRLGEVLPPDEGYHNEFGDPPLNPDNGRRMPGFADPYAANDPQPFSGYLVDERSFIARLLPLTDIDDAGRVNPFPLLRVMASRPGVAAGVAATDVAMTAGRDLHCRECHAKGGLGANPDIYPQHVGHEDPNGHGGHGGSVPPPEYVEPDSASLFDREYAAIKNVIRLHDFIVPMSDPPLAERMENGISYEKGVVTADRPSSCDDGGSCHTMPLTQTPFNQPLRIQNGPAPLSIDMHEYHGQMSYTSDKRDIVRNEFGQPVRWNPADGPNPGPLFPVKDPNGKPLPMEQNCLKCHGGQREQCYRDRMFTGGVTCYQCHGDMLAVGSSYRVGQTPQGQTNNPRLMWFEQPDCGSCHTGNGNIGKNGAGRYFSAGVMKTAFDEADPAAIPRVPDALNPDALRFAVPRTVLGVGWDAYQSHQDASGNNYYFGLRAQTRGALFRQTKDTHGGVACAACHGAAHAIWPNRNPNANDNVTANQLQGHPGTIVECGVCHTADAFSKLNDLDGGTYSGLPQNSGILGGPHGMHPVFDPNWYLSAGETPTGGLHVNVYRRGGWKGGDQCAACHGDDHTGTRLSKAAVDRSYDLPGGIHASWKAGEPVGCDRCHDLAHSFSGKAAGGGLASNHAPTIDSQPVTTVLIGQPYEYPVQASDADNNPLTFSIDPVPAGGPTGQPLHIDPQSGLVSGQFDATIFESFRPAQPPYQFDFRIIVRDSLGAETAQPVSLSIGCPSGTTWDGYICSSDQIELLPDPQAVTGLTVGETYRYRPVARHKQGLPLSFELKNAPEGVSFDAEIGLIQWTPPEGYIRDLFIIVRDGQGGEARLYLPELLVCDTRHPWRADLTQCEPMILVTSTPPPEIIPGQVYRYQVVATHREGLPLTYTFENSNGYGGAMQVDSNTGLFTWDTPASLAPGSYFIFIYAGDGSGESGYAPISATVCEPPLHWNTEEEACQ